MKMRRPSYPLMGMATFVLAMLLISCDEKKPQGVTTDFKTKPTLIVHNLIGTESENGVPKYRVETPLMEGYSEAIEPYREFREGIKIETFSKDSATIESDIRADYAHYNEAKKLWEGRGNVIARSLLEDRTLYTEQIFYDEVRKKIYTDKPAKVVDHGDVHNGIGFEADEKFKSWQFNRARGYIEVKDSTQNDANQNPGDSTQTSATKPASEKANPPSAKPDKDNLAKPDKGSSAKPDNGNSAKPDKGNPAKPDNGNSAKPDKGSSAKPDNGNSAKPQPGAFGKRPLRPAPPANPTTTTPAQHK